MILSTDQMVTFAGAIAGHVTEMMTTAHITPHRMANTTGIPLSTLRRSLAGHRPFTVDEVQRIAAVLNTTVTAIVQVAEQAA